MIKDKAHSPESLEPKVKGKDVSTPDVLTFPEVLPDIPQNLGKSSETIDGQIAVRNLSDSNALPYQITVPASGVPFKNTTGFPLQVLIRDGTLASIALSRNDVTYWGIGVLAGPVMLTPNDYLKIVYSVAPTMIGFPQ